MADSYYEVIEAIKNCMEIQIPVNPLTTISKYNSDDLIALIGLLKKIGIQRTAFNCAVPSVDEQIIRFNFVINPKNVAKKIEEVYLFSREIGIKTSFNVTIPICLFSERIRELMLSNRSLSIGCQMYYGEGVAFDCVGNILPCTHFSSFPLFTGTITKEGRFLYRENFFEIWEQGNICNDFRDKLWVYPSLECESCKYWGGCIGGCPLLWTHFNPEPVIKGGR